MKTLAEYLDLAAVAHGHLCAGQVLGVRLAMLGLRELGIDDPIAERKRLVTYVEIDRCGTDAGQQKAYAQLSDEILFDKQWVKVEVQPEDLPGFKGPRVVCAECGEGINFKREVVKDGRTLCRACSGEKYYETLPRHF